MSKNARPTDSFKQEVVDNIIVRGYSVAETADKYEVSDSAVYAWLKQFKRDTSDGRPDETDLIEEIEKLKLELVKANMEKDTLRKAALIMVNGGLSPD